jgi:hypothetical protein
MEGKISLRVSVTEGSLKENLIEEHFFGGARGDNRMVAGRTAFAAKGYDVNFLSTLLQNPAGSVMRCS